MLKRSSQTVHSVRPIRTSQNLTRLVRYVTYQLRCTRSTTAPSGRPPYRSVTGCWRKRRGSWTRSAASFASTMIMRRVTKLTHETQLLDALVSRFQQISLSKVDTWELTNPLPSPVPPRVLWEWHVRLSPALPGWQEAPCLPVHKESVRRPALLTNCSPSCCR